MVAQIESPPQKDVIYPDSDGKPMSDNTKQFRWIVTIEQNLEFLFANEPDIFIAGDLLWYPVEGNNKIRQAPDIMVVVGRPKGDRGSYQQWKENQIAPQVVFEILSPGNTFSEMIRKQSFYEHYGVEEYYIYDPDKNDFSGWIRSENRLEIIEEIQNWISPKLGIRFDVSGEELQIFHPNGEVFSNYVQTNQMLVQTNQMLAEERKKSALLAEKLRAAGIDPDQL
jgi:Uma2 family endonuclease